MHRLTKRFATTLTRMVVILAPLAAGSTCQFSPFLSLPSGDPVSKEGGPRLVSAMATDNTTVLVTFSESVQDGADDPANYTITQVDRDAVSARLLVSAAEVSPNGVTVTLRTAPQSEVLYELHVNGIFDLDGTPLAGPELLVDPTRTQFLGQGAVLGGPDSDEDGLPDALEQMGWVVTVESADKQRFQRRVTSDPSMKDTDGDGLPDNEEMSVGTDPRSADTDGDGLSDNEEYNGWYSDTNDQDTDDDGLSDPLEVNLFKTSPVLADTDGDQLKDDVELLERNRNPLIADLPVPQITVDNLRLDLKITSSYTDEDGVTHEVKDNTSTSFTQSRSDKLGTGETNTTESENTYGQKLGVEVGYGVKDGFSGKLTAEASFGQKQTRGFTSKVDRETARQSQEEYQKSVENALQTSQKRAVTRSIDQALIQANVNIANCSDIAFTIKNLEISVQQQDRRNGRLFRPIATLRPTGASDPLSQPAYNLGPFDPERGPIIFQNTDVFPNLIDDLMREPTGLIFRVANFDIVDELGRNFVFSSQEVNDRTVGITINFGDGNVETYRVATVSKFDAAGRALGISMIDGLKIIGLGYSAQDQPFPLADPPSEWIRTTFGTLTDSGGVERLTRVRGVQNDLVANPTAEKRFWAVITNNTDVSPDANFSTIQLHAGDDYLLTYTRDVDQDGLFQCEEYLYGSDDRLTDTDGDGLGDFFEVRTGWLVNKLPGLPYKTFPDPARPDSDSDGLRDDLEKGAGTDPNRADTDEDGLLDADEISYSFEVVLFDGDSDDINNKILTVAPYSSWVIIGGTKGAIETPVSGDDQKVTGSGGVVILPGTNGVIDSTLTGDDIRQLAEAIVNGPGTTCETNKEGDDIQVIAFGAPASANAVLVLPGPNGVIDSKPGGDDWIRVRHDGLFAVNPLNQDTDLDGIPDGREILVGTNPNCKDAGKVIDTDGDGLYDNEEDAGWDVVIYDSSGNPSTAAHVTSDKYRADTDLDGLPDVYEWALRSNPRQIDTDGDTLFDRDEFDPEDTDHYYSAMLLEQARYRCTQALHCTAPVLKSLADRYRTNLLKKDTDADGLDDNVELQSPWTVSVLGSEPYQVYSKPYAADADSDGLTDAQERKGADNNPATPADATDPNKADTDQDGINDNIEVARTTDPLAKDQLVRIKFLRLVVVSADDEGTDDRIEVRFHFYIEKNVKLTVVSETEWGSHNPGAEYTIDKTYDYKLRNGESVHYWSDDCTEVDPAGNDNDPFSNFSEVITAPVTTLLETKTYNLTGSDGSLNAFVSIEVITGVPSQYYWAE